MSKRNIIILLFLIIAAVVIILFLNPCGSEIIQKAAEKVGKPVPAPIPGPSAPVKKTAIEPSEKAPGVETNVPPAAHEVDLAPPVTLTSSEQIPNVAICATANFPSEAKPHVKIAIVTVRLVVDKFGNVRSDTPIDVEFPQEVDEEVLPAMRKLFIKAGSRAFGSKKCPPHVVNGQNVGYAIEVPLQYKH